MQKREGRGCIPKTCFLGSLEVPYYNPHTHTSLIPLCILQKFIIKKSNIVYYAYLTTDPGTTQVFNIEIPYSEITTGNFSFSIDIWLLDLLYTMSGDP
jgi:hypothetical protein